MFITRTCLYERLSFFQTFLYDLFTFTNHSWNTSQYSLFICSFTATIINEIDHHSFSSLSGHFRCLVNNLEIYSTRNQLSINKQIQNHSISDAGILSNIVHLHEYMYFRSYVDNCSNELVSLMTANFIFEN